jgi:hypothetical protein
MPLEVEHGDVRRLPLERQAHRPLAPPRAAPDVASRSARHLPADLALLPLHRTSISTSTSVCSRTGTREHAERLQRLVQLKRLRSSSKSSSPSFARSAMSAVGHGPEELAVFAREHVEGDRQHPRAAKHGDAPRGSPAATRSDGAPAACSAFASAHVRRARHVGEALREQVVASVAGLHLHDFAGLAQVLHVLLQYQLHVSFYP